MESYYRLTSSDKFEQNSQKKKIRLLHSAPCGPRRKQEQGVKIKSARTRKQSTDEGKIHSQTSIANYVNMAGKAEVSPRNVWVPRLHTSTDSTALSVVNRNGSTTLTFKDSSGLSRSMTWSEKDCKDCKNLHHLRELFLQRHRTKHSPGKEKRKSKDSFYSLNESDENESTPGLVSI